MKVIVFVCSWQPELRAGEMARLAGPELNPNQRNAELPAAARQCYAYI